jgi:hypothetical protein
MWLCPRCQAGPRSPSPARPMTPREASSGSPADRRLFPGSRVVLTDTISLALDVHLRFRAAPVWLSTAIPPSEPCAVSPWAARIISSLVPMPEVGVVLPDREHQAQRSKPTAPSRRCARPHPRPSALINSCPGTGSPRTRRALQPEPAPSPSATMLSSPTEKLNEWVEKHSMSFDARGLLHATPKDADGRCWHQA